MTPDDRRAALDPSPRLRRVRGEKPLTRSNMPLATSPRIVRHAERPLLVLDDLAQEAEVGIAVVAHILQHRYNQTRLTIATRSVDRAVRLALRRKGSGGDFSRRLAGRPSSGSGVVPRDGRIDDFVE